MTTPFNLTFSDIVLRVMNSLRLPTTNTTEADKINNLVNEVYRDIYLKHDWWFLTKFTAINTTPVWNTGTVSLTQNSVNIIFTDIPQLFSVNINLVGKLLLVSGQANDSDAVYRIASHTTGAAGAQLDAAYTDTTSATASFSVYTDKYALPADCGKLLNVSRYGDLIPMQRVGVETMQQMKQSDQGNSRPELYTIYDFQTSGDPTTPRMLWIHPYPDKQYRMDIYYKQQLNTDASCADQVFLPDEYRQLLIYGTLARGYPIFHKDLERGKFFQSLFNDDLALAVAQHKEYASDHAAVAPQPGYRNHRRRRGPYTMGSWFDRLPNRP